MPNPITARSKTELRLLLIEDDPTIVALVTQGMQAAGFVVEYANNSYDGMRIALTSKYDVAVIDRVLADIDCFSIVSELHALGVQLPIVVLSSKRFVAKPEKRLQAGAVDYLRKPFAFSELLARVEALIRRTKNIPEATWLTIGSLSIDLIEHRVTREGKRIYLRPLEFSLLVYLTHNADHVVTKAMIMEQVWDFNIDPQSNIVDSLVCRLRDKIDTGFSTPLVHTVRGKGYILKDCC